MEGQFPLSPPNSPTVPPLPPRGPEVHLSPAQLASVFPALPEGAREPQVDQQQEQEQEQRQEIEPKIGEVQEQDVLQVHHHGSLPLLQMEGREPPHALHHEQEMGAGGSRRCRRGSVAPVHRPPYAPEPPAPSKDNELLDTLRGLGQEVGPTQSCHLLLPAFLLPR